MLKMSLRPLIMATLVITLFGCDKKIPQEAANHDVERFSHDLNSCPQLAIGSYWIAGIPESQKESITVGTDNHFKNSVFVNIEGRGFKARPTGEVSCQDYGVKTDDRLCFMGGCQAGAFVVSYSGVAGGKKVKGMKTIRPLDRDSLQVSDNRNNSGPRTQEYKRN